MKPTRLLALAAAFIGSAVAYGVHLFTKHETIVRAAPVAAKAKSTTGIRPSSGAAAGQESVRRPRVSQNPTAADSAPAVAAFQPRRLGGSPDFGSGKILSESQWRENAARVEMEANHELNRLSALLDLDPYQQDKVFSTLARNSPYWLPGMQAGGSIGAGESATTVSGTKTGGRNPSDSSAGSLAVTPGGQSGGSLVTNPASAGQVENADLTAVLNPEQQQTALNDAADREEWWAEVLPQLLPPTVSGETTAVTGGTTSTEDTTTVPETKEFDGGDVLIEE